ncbi:MAG: hypothetical protein LUO96_03010 [Methanomicrobiales archaeon]|nr:hypothetical protein [Methanomicrobiales archaeon]
MSPRSCRQGKAAVLLAALGLLLVLAIQPGTALTVENPKILSDVAPGTSRFPMAVLLKPDEAAADYTVEVLGFGQAGDGVYTPLAAADDTGMYSARALITVDPAGFHLDPGQRQPVNVNISVPEKAGDGGRYALLHIHPSGAAAGQTAITTGIYVPVMLTLKGSSLTHTGSITGIQAGEVTPGKPLLVSTAVSNTGNHHYYGLMVNLTLTDQAGKVVAVASSPGSVYALIPGNGMTIATPITTPLGPGTYTVTSEARLADGMVLLDTGDTTMTIRTAYVPPVTQTTPAGGTQAEGPKKLPFLPIYVPGPDALLVSTALSAALLLWSRRR